MVTDRMPPDVLENWINSLSVAEQRTIRAARRARLLEEGPGGIMEMKQTIANLERYRDLIHFIANDYIELSYDKAQCQRDDWWKRCNKLMAEMEKDEDRSHDVSIGDRDPDGLGEDL